MYEKILTEILEIMCKKIELFLKTMMIFSTSNWFFTKKFLIVHNLWKRIFRKRDPYRQSFEFNTLNAVLERSFMKISLWKLPLFLQLKRELWDASGEYFH